MVNAPINIVALGDSKTVGVGDADGMGGYPKRIEAWIKKRHPQSTVYAFGALGWTSTDVVQQVLNAAITKQPQIVMVWIGSNDVWKTAHPAQAAQGLTTFEANLDTILQRLQHANAQLVVGLLDDMSQCPIIKTFSNITQDDIHYLAQLIQRYNATITQLAAQYKAVIVHFHEAAMFRDPIMFADDGTHPNESGYDQIAQMWWNALQPLL